jgi:plasmid maintenance system killer protein
LYDLTLYIVNLHDRDVDICFLARYICLAYSQGMVRSFADKETKLIYNQERSKKLPAEIQERALIKLMLIDAAEKVSGLKAPTSNRLEKLKGDLETTGRSGSMINGESSFSLRIAMLIT